MMTRKKEALHTDILSSTLYPASVPLLIVLNRRAFKRFLLVFPGSIAEWVRMIQIGTMTRSLLLNDHYSGGRDAIMTECSQEPNESSDIDDLGQESPGRRINNSSSGRGSVQTYFKTMTFLCSWCTDGWRRQKFQTWDE
jgi:hypothetical protein